MENQKIAYMENQEIVRKAADYIFTLFKEKLSRKLVYHNYKHTFETVKEAKELGEAYKLPPEELEVLQLAAWFHDSGYIDAYIGHEEKSVERATAYLQEQGYPADRLTRVQACIMATKNGVPSESLLEDILVDADMANVGKETFFSSAELLRVEWEIFLDRSYSNSEWAKFQLDFLESMKYRTEEAQKKFSERLGLNIQEQRNLLEKEAKKVEKKKKEQETFAQPKRGIETMFRSTYRVHINLSAIADQKANMMISLNAIIMSVIITYLGAKTSVLGSEFARNPVLFVPVGILLLTTLGSLIGAIMSAQPEVTSRSVDKKSLDTNRSSILFFGNFTKLPLEDFQKGMKDIMTEKDSLYTNMITDIYYLGDVLSRKYQMLRVSYTIFMFGLILTVLSFIVAISVKAT
jgi:predicted metal-dependent HD superfamily phosphohydrolase